MVQEQCRTCKSASDSLISVFNEETVENEVLTYSQMIFYCTSVQVRIRISFYVLEMFFGYSSVIYSNGHVSLKI